MFEFITKYFGSGSQNDGGGSSNNVKNEDEQKIPLEQIVLGKVANQSIPVLGKYATYGEELRDLYSQGKITDSDLDESITKAIIKQARRDYDLLTEQPLPYTLYPDHIQSEESFAYALENGEFTEIEVSKINFDCQTPKEYARKYGDSNLIKNIRKELLNPKPLLKFDLSDTCCPCDDTH